MPIPRTPARATWSTRRRSTAAASASTASSSSRDGQLTFDAAKFTAAYNADPAGIQQAGIGLADNFEAMADKQSLSVTAVITGRKNEIDTINDQISNWDVRLAAKREALQKQYADLETALGKLKDQSSWLSGQLSGLS